MYEIRRCNDSDQILDLPTNGQCQSALWKALAAMLSFGIPERKHEPQCPEISDAENNALTVEKSKKLLSAYCSLYFKEYLLIQYLHWLAVYAQTD